MEQKPLEKLLSVITLEMDSHIPYKKEREDALFVDQVHSIFVVTDGVTRTPNEWGEYPHPSPARMAAETAAKAIGVSLAGTKTDIVKAFAKGNEAVKRLNEKLGLWENHDYLARDFAGTVGACFIRQSDNILYGYIADSGIAQISPTGELIWQSTDDVAVARQDFPKAESGQNILRSVKIRKDFRNNPSANHKTFGVLTGEDAALEYVKTGSLPCNQGKVTIVYSDGMLALLEGESFRKLLLVGTYEEIKIYIDKQSSPEKNYDEKTLIVLRT